MAPGYGGRGITGSAGTGDPAPVARPAPVCQHNQPGQLVGHDHPRIMPDVIKVGFEPLPAPGDDLAFRAEHHPALGHLARDALVALNAPRKYMPAAL